MSAALLAIVAAEFSNSYSSGMVLDNKYIIEEYYKTILRSDPKHELKSWKQIALIFLNDYWWPKGISGLYRPITTFTYWVDYVILTGKPDKDAQGRPKPMTWRDYAWTPRRQLNTDSYHTINFILHWLNAVLVYFVTLMLLQKLWPAAFTAALFASHPIVTESVTNIIGRADMFAATTVFGGLLIYARSQRHWNSWALPWLVGLMLITAFGLFSKESAAALVLVMLVFDITYRWRAKNRQQEGLLVLVIYGLAYLLVMIGVPILADSMATVLLGAGSQLFVWKIVRVTAAVLAMACGLIVYGACLRAKPSVRLASLGGLLAATVLATIFMAHFPTPDLAHWPAVFRWCWLLFRYFPIVLTAAVGVVELVLLWLVLLKQDRFAELPRMIGHGLIYLALTAAMIGVPLLCSWLAAKHKWTAAMPAAPRYFITFAALALGLFAYLVTARGSHAERAASLTGCLLAVILATLLVPYYPLAVSAIVLLVELLRGSLSSNNHRYRILAHATLYVMLFFALIGLPIGALWFYRHMEWDEWFEPWLRFPLAGLAFAAGLFIHLFTLKKDRIARAAALTVVALASVVASFHSYWMGILLGIIVATHELILATLLPRSEQYRRDWKLIWHGFAIGYLMTIPPLVAMFVVRHWVFSNSSPAETPFLDNPIRGIWMVQELNIPEFAEELAKKPMPGMSFIECKLTAVKILGRLLLLLSWPKTLSADYSYAQIPNFSWHLNRWDDWQAMLAAAAMAAIAFAAARLYRRQPAVFFLILFFFAAGLPTSNLVITIGSVMAERFMYLPLAGFTGVLAVLVFWGAEKLWKRLAAFQPERFIRWDFAAKCLLGAIVAVYAARGWIRNFDWMSDLTLWTAARRDSPRSFRSYQSLAFALYEEHPTANVDKMIEVAEGALPIVDPLPNHLNSSRLYLHLGMYYSIKGDLLSQKNPDGTVSLTPQAEYWYRKAISILERGSQVDRAFNQVNRAKQFLRGDDPETIGDAGLGPIYGTMAMAYARLGMLDTAYRRLQYQRQLDPSDPDAYAKLATIQLAMRRPDDAAVSLIQTILLDPGRPEVWNTLVQIYAQMGDRGRATIVYDGKAYKLNLSHPVVREQMVSAYRDFIRGFRRARRPQMAEEARKVAIQRYDFPRSLFDPLFNEPIPIVTPDGFIYPAN